MHVDGANKQVNENAHMGTLILPESEMDCWRARSPSRLGSLS